MQDKANSIRLYSNEFLLLFFIPIKNTYQTRQYLVHLFHSEIE